MIVLVTGGSGSGKSEYAEKRIMDSQIPKRLYLATMKPWDRECEKKITRHQKLRAYKGFHTVEKYSCLKELRLEKKPDEPVAVLLECLSNLASNELFDGEIVCGDSFFGRCKRAEEEIFEGILKLSVQADLLVIVTVEVFSDGDGYSLETNGYRRVLASLNQRIGNMAGQVIEVVAGIPILIKK